MRRYVALWIDRHIFWTTLVGFLFGEASLVTQPVAQRLVPGLRATGCVKLASSSVRLPRMQSAAAAGAVAAGPGRCLHRQPAATELAWLSATCPPALFRSAGMLLPPATGRRSTHFLVQPPCRPLQPSSSSSRFSQPSSPLPSWREQPQPAPGAWERKQPSGRLPCPGRSHHSLPACALRLTLLALTFTLPLMSAGVAAYACPPGGPHLAQPTHSPAALLWMAP